MRVRSSPLAWTLVLLSVACGPPPEEAVDLDESAAFDPKDPCFTGAVDARAVIFNDLPALAARGIHLRRVLTALAAQTPSATDSADTLYADMAATLVLGFGGNVTLDQWYGVALINRFDLAPKEADTCGEYRLVVSRPRNPQGPGGALETSRFTLIFEAAVPNPHPELGLEGCRPLQLAWARAGAVVDPVARAAELETIYFDGVGGFPPVVSAANYGADGLGQVRANFFLNGSEGPWFLDEFRLVRTFERRWGLHLEDRPVADTPGVSFFAAGPPADRTVALLREDFIRQLGDLARAPDRIRYTVPEGLRAARTSAAVNPNPEGFVGPVGFAGTFLHAGGDSSDFGQQIAAGMAARGITGITPTQMVRRAFTQSCGGCHDDVRADIGGGQSWPTNTPQGRVFIIDPNGQLSGPLVAFLPARVANLRDFVSCAP